MPPLNPDSEKWTILGFWDVDSSIVRKLLQCSVVVVSGAFGCKCKHVHVTKKDEGSACPRLIWRGRVKTATKELPDFRNTAGAPAEINGNFVDTVCVQNREVRVTRFGI